MRAAEYECASLPTRRVSRLQSQRQEAKSQDCLLKRLCRTNQGQSRRICPVSISIRPHSRVDAKCVRKIGESGSQKAATKNLATVGRAALGSTAPLRRARPAPTIELRPANDLEARVQPVEVPGDDDYTLS